MDIAFHCPNCSADLIFDESKKYRCCFCHADLTPADEVLELEGGYYVSEAWDEKAYHSFTCEECGGQVFARVADGQKMDCPLCGVSKLTDKGPALGAMPRRMIPFSYNRQKAESVFEEYCRNNSAVGRALVTDENKALLKKVYVPCWIFNYEVLANVRLTAMLKHIPTQSILDTAAPEQLKELIMPLRSSFKKINNSLRGVKGTQELPTERITGGVLSWMGVPFDATGCLPDNTVRNIQPYDFSKMVPVTTTALGDVPVVATYKDAISMMQEFMGRIKKWTRQMIYDAHSVQYDISFYSDKTDYPLGIGELVLLPIWAMRGEYLGREFHYAMNAQNGVVEANIPMAKVASQNDKTGYHEYANMDRCTALKDTHFEFDLYNPAHEILDYSFFEKPKTRKPKKPDDFDAQLMVHTATEADIKADEEAKKRAEAMEKRRAEAANRPEGAPLLDIPIVTNISDLTKMPQKKKLEPITRPAAIKAAAKENPGEMKAAVEAPAWAKNSKPTEVAVPNSNRTVRTKKPAIEKKETQVPVWDRPQDASVNAFGAHVPEKKVSSMKAKVNGEEEQPIEAVQAPASTLSSSKTMEQNHPAWESAYISNMSDVQSTQIASPLMNLDGLTLADLDAETINSLPLSALRELKRREAAMEQPSTEEKNATTTVSRADNDTDDSLKSTTKKGIVESADDIVPDKSRKTKSAVEKADDIVLQAKKATTPKTTSQPLPMKEEVTPVGADTFEKEEQHLSLSFMEKKASIIEEEKHMPLPMVEKDEDVLPTPKPVSKPLAPREPSPLAQMARSVSTPSEDDSIHMPRKPIWGEMPAGETPDWAKKPSASATTVGQNGQIKRPPRPNMSVPASQDSTLQHKAPVQATSASEPTTSRESVAATRPGAASRPGTATRSDSTTSRPTVATNAPSTPKTDTSSVSRSPLSSAITPPPTWGRPEDSISPFASRRSVSQEETQASTTAAQATSGPAMRGHRSQEENSSKSVPIWERSIRSDRPIPTWASPSTGLPEPEDTKPRFAKPQDIVINVEKPRNNSVLAAADHSATSRGGEMPLHQKEELTIDEDKQPSTSSSSANEPAATRPGSALRPNTTLDETVNTSVRGTEDESSPITFSSDRPRTYRERRALEEAARQANVQAAFKASSEDAPVFAPKAEQPVEEPVEYTRSVPMTIHTADDEESNREQDVEVLPAFSVKESTINVENTNMAAVMLRPGSRTVEESNLTEHPTGTTLQETPQPVATGTRPPEDEGLPRYGGERPIPSLAYGGMDPIRKGIVEEEAAARRSLSDIPKFDPNGPSPFAKKPIRRER